MAELPRHRQDRLGVLVQRDLLLAGAQVGKGLAEHQRPLGVLVEQVKFQFPQRHVVRLLASQGRQESFTTGHGLLLVAGAELVGCVVGRPGTPISVMAAWPRRCWYL